MLISLRLSGDDPETQRAVQVRPELRSFTMPEPKIIELDDAVSRIKQACEWAKKKHVTESGARISPFFFMVGAGLSVPSVPLASDIIEQCIAEAGKQKREIQSFKDPLQNYSHSFEVAFPDPTLRQSYLRELIEKQPISHANFRLAHLLLHKTVSNMVVTTNFDDFLSRALTLFGRSHIVCDHPQTAGRIDHTKDDIQIVHLHGTYWFYDCCNLQGEVEDRAAEETATAMKMTSLLNHILWNRSPLIIGYSGWERDVFMQALARRLHGKLGTSAYWFLYKKSDLDGIPEKIRNHPNIYFVATEAKPNAATSVAAKTLSASGQLGASAVSEPDEAKQPADAVLGRLVKAFELREPALTSDPLGFFALHLEGSLPGGDASDIDILYNIKSVVDRVRRAKDRETQEKDAAVGVMDCVRSAMRRADYRQVINCLPEEDVESFQLPELQELSDALFTAAVESKDLLEGEIRAYDLVVKVCDRIAVVRGRNILDEHIKVARTLNIKAFRLVRMGRAREAVEVYSEIERRFGDANENELREWVAKALRSKGATLVELNQLEEAIAIYVEIEERYGSARELVFREQVARALADKGFVLGQMNRSDEELVAYEEVERRYGGASELGLRETLAIALRNKGLTLQVRQSERALEAFGELDQRYRDANELVLRKQVAMALVNKGFTLERLGRAEEAIEVYLEVERRYGDASESMLRKQVAMAMRNRGILLEEKAEFAEALAVFEDLERRFGESNEFEISEQVAKALVNKGYTLDKMNRREEAMAVYDQVERRYGNADESVLREQVETARRNKELILEELKLKSES